jgi:hypothetical protein
VETYIDSNPRTIAVTKTNICIASSTGLKTNLCHELVIYTITLTGIVIVIRFAAITAFDVVDFTIFVVVVFGIPMFGVSVINHLPGLLKRVSFDSPGNDPMNGFGLLDFKRPGGHFSPFLLTLVG